VFLQRVETNRKFTWMGRMDENSIQEIETRNQNLTTKSSKGRERGRKAISGQLRNLTTKSSKEDERLLAAGF
jgi:hypothetical protein